jgi:hypothetical protein
MVHTWLETWLELGRLLSSAKPSGTAFKVDPCDGGRGLGEGADEFNETI